MAEHCLMMMMIIWEGRQLASRQKMSLKLGI
jgi:hypothetical protein